MSNMVIQTNMLSLNAHRNMGITGTAQARSSARLSSGFRINSAADDAAGLAISEKMRGQIRGLDQASRNAQDGISLIQTAEGAMQTINDMVIRIRELVIQAANDTNVHQDARPELSDRVQIQREIDQLLEEIDAVTIRTEFNTRTLLNGDWAGAQPARASDAAIAAATEAATASVIADGTAGVVATITALQADLQAAFAAATVTGNTIVDITDFVNDGIAAVEAAVAATIEAIVADTNLTSAQAATAFTLSELDAIASALADFDPADVTASLAAINDAITSAMADLVDFGVTAFNDAGLTAGTTALAGFEAALAAAFTNRTEMLDPGEFAVLDPAAIGWLETAQLNFDNGIQGLELTRTSTLEQITAAVEENAAFMLRAEIAAAVAAAVADLPLDVPATEGNSLWFQIGANEGQGIRVNIEAVNTTRMGINNFHSTGFPGVGGAPDTASTGRHAVTVEPGEYLGNDTEAREAAQGLVTLLDEALAHVTGQRAILGAVQNRLEFTILNLDTASENLQAANSRIRDADMAREMMRFTQTNVLQQAAISMLAQANQAPQNILQLLR